MAVDKKPEDQIPDTEVATAETTEAVHEQAHDDPTILMRWFQRGLEQGTSFWITVGIVLAAAVALGAAITLLLSPSKAGAEAWSGLIAASGTAGSLEGVMVDPRSQWSLDFNGTLQGSLREFQFISTKIEWDGTEASEWALLRYASFLLLESSIQIPDPSESLNALPDSVEETGKKAGATRLIEAMAIYQELQSSDGPESIRRQASLGFARAAEACLALGADDRNQAIGKFQDDALPVDLVKTINELDREKVLSLYETTAEKFPETPEGKLAGELAEKLSTPQAASFYVYLADPPSDPLGGLTLPTGSTGSTFDPTNPGFQIAPPIDPVDEALSGLLNEEESSEEESTLELPVIFEDPPSSDENDSPETKNEDPNQ